MNVRHIRIDIDPTAFCRFDGPAVYMARVEVDVQGMDRICYSQAIPSDDFTRRFDFMMDMAKREILHHLKEPGIVIE